MHVIKGIVVHPYAWRTSLRKRLPWFLINLGIAAKGKDCERVGAEHHWYQTPKRRLAITARSFAPERCDDKNQTDHYSRLASFVLT